MTLLPRRAKVRLRRIVLWIPFFTPGSAMVVWAADMRYLAGHIPTAALTLGLGIATLCDDPMRFVSPAFSSIQQFYGGVRLWGTILVIGGALLFLAIFGTCRTMRWALLGTGVLHLFMAWSFWDAYITTNTASSYGWMLFAAVAIRHVTQSLLFPDLRVTVNEVLNSSDEEIPDTDDSNSQWNGDPW